MLAKILSLAITSDHQLLKQKINRLAAGENIFKGDGADETIELLLHLKNLGISLIEEFSRINFFAYLKAEQKPEVFTFNYNDYSPLSGRPIHLSSIADLSKARKSIYVCLINLRESNKKAIKEQMAKNIASVRGRLSEDHKDIPRQLGQAAYDNDVYRMQALLELVNDINSKELREKELLINAAKDGHLEIVKLLIAKGINVNQKPEIGEETALIKAIENKYVDIVRELIKAKVDVNVVIQNQETPLIKACDKGCPFEIIEMLIKAGADVNAKAVHGNTALYEACGHCGDDADDYYLPIVKLLLACRADTNVQGWRETTPLIKAVNQGHLKIVRELLEADADTNIKDDNEKTALFYAVEDNNLKMAKLLIEYEADVNIPEKFYEYPIHIAIRKNNLRMLRLLIKAGAHKNVAKKIMSETPLFEALDKPILLAELLKYKIRLNKTNSFRQTALMEAAEHGNEAAVKMLLKAGARIDLKDWENRTALDIAKLKKRNTIVSLLEAAASEVNIQKK
ncbi:MAG: ankyrin repeat domain-containing protein [Candidatus Margulisbacteria bacterium]|nr:ankyrin repeat domain-containing protein [Candidatus Margulisiibacteriota bacterium]